MLPTIGGLIGRNISNQIKRSILAPLISSSHYYQQQKYKSKSMSRIENERLIWVDCEMTGLDITKDVIMEIAVIVTEGDQTLSEVCRSESLIIQTSKSLLDGMDDWCTQHHGDSGLTQSCLDSKLTMEAAETELLTLLQNHTQKGKCPLAGNSVGQDRKFLEKCMPSLAEHLHYRTVDVSTVKELCKRWNPKIYQEMPSKRLSHRALEDIEDSIAELKYYKKTFLIPRTDI